MNTKKQLQYEFTVKNLEFVKKSAIQANIGMLLLAVLIYYIVSPYAHSAMNLWLLVSFLNAILRGYFAFAYDKANPTKTIIILACIDIVISICHSIVLYVPDLPLLERTILTTLLCAVAIMSINMNPSIKWLYIPYLIIVPANIGLALFLTLDTLNEGFLGYLLIILVLNYIFIGIKFGMNMENSLWKEHLFVHEKEVLNKKLEDSLIQTKKLSDSKTRFIASASHDLRQPIHVLSFLNANLQMTELTDEQKEYVYRMENTTYRLSNELNTLLDLSKLDAGNFELVKETVQIQMLFDHLFLEFEPIAKEKGLELTFVQSKSYQVKTDRLSCIRILRNIISNAIKYTESGYVRIIAESIHGQLVISVADTGVGISHENKEKIFEEFFQIDNEVRDTAQGAGLGLSIVKRLCGLLEWNIEVSNNDMLGTKFSVCIPEYEMKERKSIEALRKTHAHQSSWKEKRILLLDDTLDVVETVASYLRKLECDVVSFIDMLECLDYINNQIKNIDMVIMDYQMNNKHDGSYFMNVVKEIDDTLPCIVVSGITDDMKIHEIATRTNTRFLQKPVNYEMLHKTIEEMFIEIRS